jgi:Chaperone of endosialidase
MPRNTSSIYYVPPGTEGFPDTTIESEKYNNYIADVAADLNLPRPIVAGGTGADDANEALANLGAEKSSQEIKNYNADVFLPGSFYSAANATNPPVANHAFVGWAVSSDKPATPPADLNVVVQARDQNDIAVPGRLYVREKKAGVWGPWGIDGGGISSATPPTNPPDGMLWWDSEGGHLYVYYNDGNSKQWVIASPFSDPKQFLLKAGDTMTGALGLATAPTTDMQAVNKKYVDDKVAADLTSRVAKAGDTMTGNLTINGASIYCTGGSLTTGYSTMFGGPGVATGFYSDGGNVAIRTYGGNNIYLQSGSGGTTYLNVANGLTTANGQMSATRFVLTSQNSDLYSDANQSTWYLNGGACYLNYLKAIGRLEFGVNGAQMFRAEWSGADFIVNGNGWKPGGGVWADSNSDIRAKNIKGEYTIGLEAVSKLRPVAYTFKGNNTNEPPDRVRTAAEKAAAKANEPPVEVPYPNSDHYQAAKSQKEFIGLIAQEVEEIFPAMVSKRAGYLDGKPVDDLRSLDTSQLIFALVNAVKELKARIETLEAKT